MSLNHVSAIGLAVMLLLTGCMGSDDLEKDDSDLTTAKESDDNVLGCTYASADNYNLSATVDDGSCSFEDALEGEYDEGYLNGTEDGYNDGYYEGYNDGYDEGYLNGTEEGYDDGYYEGYNDGYDDGYDEGYYDGYDDASITSTLDTIIERGYLICGVKGNQYGMGYWDEDSETYTGLDIEYCKAIAAAIGLNPDTDIEYIPTSGSNRWDYLASKIIDVLIRTSTWTTARDADLNADFAGINFYDGQGILVNKDVFPNATSALHLDGAKICVAIGSTSAGNIADYFSAYNIQYDAVQSDYEDDDFKNEECDAITGDMSALVASKWTLTQDDEVEFEMAIMPNLLSKEPLAAATRDNDDDWNDVVTWVWYGMLTAEELGITSSNYGSANMSIPANDRLLNNNLGLGTETNPLAATWMQSVLATSGNYYEAYDNSFCDGAGTMSNCLIERAGTQNAPHWQGGLQYAPPMR
jgi:general L-amino acid transport system substrate-binding protein